jgi:DNA-binding transcriptional regulator GbsR (MarR family)
MDNKSTLLDEIRTEKISKLKDSIKKIMSELDSKNDTIKKEILELEEKLKGLKKEYQENSYLMENWNENFAENNVEYIEDVIAKYSNGIENAEIQK